MDFLDTVEINLRAGKILIHYENRYVISRIRARDIRHELN